MEFDRSGSVSRAAKAGNLNALPDEEQYDSDYQYNYNRALEDRIRREKIAIQNNNHVQDRDQMNEIKYSRSWSPSANVDNDYAKKIQGSSSKYNP